MAEKECVVCGIAFQAPPRSRRTQITCSKPCGKEHRKNTQREGQRKRNKLDPQWKQDTVREYYRRWRSENGERLREYHARYYEIHRDSHKEKRAMYYRRRREEDPEYYRNMSRRLDYNRLISGTYTEYKRRSADLAENIRIRKAAIVRFLTENGVDLGKLGDNKWRNPSRIPLRVLLAGVESLFSPGEKQPQDLSLTELLRGSFQSEKKDQTQPQP